MQTNAQYKKRNAINDIPQREAETTEERLLLGLLNQEADRVSFGRIVVELGVRGGKIDRVTLTEVSRVVNIGLRDQAGKNMQTS